MSKIAICPRCNSEITELEATELGTDMINESVKRSGYSDLDGGNIEIDDTENLDSDCVDSETDETLYFCPECKEELCPEDLEIKDKIETNKTKKKITKPVPIPVTDLICRRLNNINYEELSFVICAKCKTSVEIMSSDGAGHREEEVECTHCGKTIKRNKE